MAATLFLDPKDPQDTITLQVDFALLLPVGATVASLISLTPTIVPPLDIYATNAVVDNLLINAALPVGTFIEFQAASGTSGNYYILDFLVLDSDGNQRHRSALLPIQTK